MPPQDPPLPPPGPSNGRSSAEQPGEPAKRQRVARGETAEAEEVDEVQLVASERVNSSKDSSNNNNNNNTLTNVVRFLSDAVGITKSRDGELREKLERNLEYSTMFKKCNRAQIEKLAELFHPVEFKRGEVLQLQGEPQKRALVIVEGTVSRQRLVDDQMHQVAALGAAGSSATVGMLHLLRNERCYSTLKATSNGYAFEVTSRDLETALRGDPDLALSVIHSLTHEVRLQTSRNASQTPLFLQRGKQLSSAPLPWFAVTCAAAVESFYRSGMNSLINAAITGKERAALFPNMHVQVPVRVVYINGFKGLRYFFDNKVNLDDYDYPQLVGAAVAVSPGVIMSPVSSMLEASNAGHSNPEPLAIRWTRGLVPRVIREVIFGVGINQLSDYYEERVPFFHNNQTMRNLAGSFAAGLVAGYLSHVPHSLSALKLLNPQKSYREIFNNYTSTWDARVAPSSSPWRPYLVKTLACVFPKGCLVRSAQISGSFIIINSAINALKHVVVDVRVDRSLSS